MTENMWNITCITLFIIALISTFMVYYTYKKESEHHENNARAYKEKFYTSATVLVAAWKEYFDNLNRQNPPLGLLTTQLFRNGLALEVNFFPNTKENNEEQFLFGLDLTDPNEPKIWERGYKGIPAIKTFEQLRVDLIAMGIRAQNTLATGKVPDNI